ncbi:hypothetical protein BDDG_12952, partial [Blastomyces dermatitidis ATCC 18188]
IEVKVKSAAEDIHKKKDEEKLKLTEADKHVTCMYCLYHDDKTDLCFQKNEKPAQLSVLIMQNLTVEELTNVISIIERLAECSEK